MRQNFGRDKRRKEEARKKKQEEKRNKRLNKKNPVPSDLTAPENSTGPAESFSSTDRPE